MVNYSQIPSGITTIDDQELPFSGVDKIFAQTDLGKTLQDNVRYERYRPPHLSKTDWQKILGADINNLTHMPLTRGLTRAFLAYQYNGNKFPKEDAAILLLAATTHDWAEAIVGDKMADLKTEAEEAAETDLYSHLLKKYLGRYLSPAILYKTHQTATDRESPLGKPFNAIERTGYLRSGLNAWRSSQKADGQLKQHLQWMASNVLGNQTIPLIRYAEAYYPIEHYLDNVRFTISEIFENIPETAFDQYPDDGKNEKAVQIDKFMDAKQAWFRSSFGPIF